MSGGAGSGAEATSILIVDDEEELRDVLRFCFETEGFTVETAQSGNQARSLLASRSFDVILTDVRMPDGDGLELLKGLCQPGAFPPPVAFLMTGFRDLEIEDAAALGVRTILRKPFVLDELMAAVREGVSDRAKH